MIILPLLLLAMDTPGDLPRPTDIRAVSDRSLPEIQACVARYWASKGRVTTLLLEDGVALDFQLSTFSLGPPGKPIMTFEIHDTGDQRSMTIAYRHPFSAKMARKFFVRTGKECFPDDVATTTEP